MMTNRHNTLCHLRSHWGSKEGPNNQCAVSSVGLAVVGDAWGRRLLRSPASAATAAHQAGYAPLRGSHQEENEDV
jgi:hypothetical protein